VKPRTPLTHDDLASLHDLATKTLDTKALSVRIATVSGARGTFLSCHLCLPLLAYRSHTNLGVLLPVTLTLAIAGLVLKFHDANLFALGVS
jgi:hypothetical protein